jgi:ribosome-binding protein aMBF1 (putative translation factor)
MANRDDKEDVAYSPQRASPIPSAPATPVRLIAVRSPTRASNADLRRRFGEIVRIERTRRALSQEDLAARSSLHRTHFSLAECGRRDVRLTTICAIAAALRVHPGTLMPPLS